MKVITFNIRCCGDPDGHSIDERAPRLKATLDRYDGDIVGFQEVTPHWYGHLVCDFSDKYEIFNKYRSTGDWSEAMTVMWKREKFTCLDEGYFWFSDTPWIESMGKDSIGCKRICQWVRLREVGTGKDFCYLNLHFGFGDGYQSESVELIKKTADIMGTEKIFITGDFNMFPGSQPYIEMTERFADVNVLTENYTGATYHGYGKEAGEHIDYCFIGKEVEARGYRLLDDTFDGKYPSDHYGILFELEV